MTHQEQMNFINHFIPLFQKESYKRGYSIISTPIAQTIIEGNWGRSTLAKYHNHWGLKCGSSWKGPSVNLKTREEYQPGILTTIKDNFRVYNSDEEGVKGYYDFISTKRYANLKTIDCSSNTGAKTYEIVGTRKGQLVRVIFEPSQKLVDGIRLLAPRKVFYN